MRCMKAAKSCVSRRLPMQDNVCDSKQMHQHMFAGQCDSRHTMTRHTREWQQCSACQLCGAAALRCWLLTSAVEMQMCQAMLLPQLLHNCHTHSTPHAARSCPSPVGDVQCALPCLPNSRRPLLLPQVPIRRNIAILEAGWVAVCSVVITKGPLAIKIE